MPSYSEAEIGAALDALDAEDAAPPEQPPSPELTASAESADGLASVTAIDAALDELDAEDAADDDLLRNAFASSLEGDVERRVAVARLAEDLGVAPGLVERNFDSLRATWARAGFDPKRWRTDNGAAARIILRRPDLAAPVMEDAETLTAFSKVVRGAWAINAGAIEESDELPLWARFLPPAVIGAQAVGAVDAIRSGAVEKAMNPEPRVVVDDERAREGREAEGLLGVAKRTYMAFEDKRAQDRVAILGTELAFARRRGEDTWEIEAQLQEALDRAQPRDYGQGEAEQFLHDAADVAGSLASQAEGAGAGALAGGALLGGGALLLPATRPAAGALAREGLLIGAKAGATTASFSTEFGSSYLAFIDATTEAGDPIDDDTAFGAAILAASVKSGIEAVSFGASERMAGPLFQRIMAARGKDAASALLRDSSFRTLATKIGKAWAEKSLYETGEEISQEYVDSVVNLGIRELEAEGFQGVLDLPVRATFGDEIAWSAEGFTPIGAQAMDPEAGASAVAAGAKAGSGSLVLGGLGAASSTLTNAIAAHGARAYRKRQGSEKSAAVAEAILDLADSKTGEASPSELAAEVAAETARMGEEVRSVFVDPAPLARWFQEHQADPAELLGSEGAQKLRAAIDAGAKFEVSVADLFSKWAKHPAREALKDNLATRPAHETRAELKASSDAQLEKDARALADKYVAENTPPSSAAEERLVEAVQRQLAATGTYSDEEATKAVALTRAFLRTKAAQFELPADQLFGEYVLRVERGEGPAPAAPARKGKRRPPPPPVEALAEEPRRRQPPPPLAEALVETGASTPTAMPAPAPAPEAPATASAGPATTATPAAGGTETRVVTPQRPQGERATYRVIEAADLIASHDPETFQPNPAYPAGVQEREYHRQPEEQTKVAMGAQALDPALLLADTPTAVDGPPQVTARDRALVVGGNGRSMMLRRAMKDPAAAARYRAALAAKAPQFGIAPETLAGMKEPVLVRVLEDVSAAADQAALVAAVRRTNEGMTQALSPRARAVAEARTLSTETVASLAELLAEDPEASLRDVMRERSGRLVEILRRDGIVTAQNASSWVAGGNLTDEAKDRIEGMFLGRVVGSGDRMAATAPAVLAKLERVAGPLLRVAGVNPEADETETIQEAIDLLNDARRRNLSLRDVVHQTGLFGEDQHDPAVVRMAQLLDETKPRDLSDRFKAWADFAAFDPRQGSLFAPNPTADQVRAKLLGPLVLRKLEQGELLILFQPGIDDGGTAAALASERPPDVSEAAWALSRRADEQMALSPEERARVRGIEYGIDPLTGIWKRRALEAQPVPKGMRVAAITTPYAKPINDHPTAGGHDVTNELFRLVGVTLGKSRPEAARGGTTFYFYVPEDGAKEALAEALQELRAAVGQNVRFYGGVAPRTAVGAKAQIAEASQAAETKIDYDRAKERLAPRGEPPPELDVPGLTFEAKPLEGRLPPPQLIDEVKDLDPKAYFEKVYVTPEGLLTAEGREALPRKKYQLAVDGKGVGKANKTYGWQVGTTILTMLREAMVRIGGLDFAGCNLSGDEFVFESDNVADLERFNEALHEALDGTMVEGRVKEGLPGAGETHMLPVDFRGEPGRTYGEGDRNLNLGRLAEAGDAGARARLEARRADLGSREGTWSRPGRGSPAAYHGRGPASAAREAPGEVADPSAAPKRFEQGEAPMGPAWFSAVERSVLAAKQAKNTPQAWLSLIKKTPGVRQEELDFLGLADWLGAQKGSVSREQIAEYVRAHNLRIDEKELGGAAGSAVDPTAQAIADARAAYTAGRNAPSQAGSADARDAEIVAELANEALVENRISTASDRAEHAASLDARWEPLRDAIAGIFDVDPNDPRYQREGASQYANYTLGGHTDGSYREILFYAPGTPAADFTAPHFGAEGQGLLAHARTSEHVTEFGEKVLLVEEIQSDLHQQGREHGYTPPDYLEQRDAVFARLNESAAAFKTAAAERGVYPDQADRAINEIANGVPAADVIARLAPDAPADLVPHAEAFAQARQAHREFTGRFPGDEIPDAPLKTTWDEMVAKRVLRLAAEQGYTKIAWTTGEQQAKRYDLSKDVAEITYRPALEQDGRQIVTTGEIEVVGRDGRVLLRREAKPDDLPEIIGKDNARRLLGTEAAGIGADERAKDDAEYRALVEELSSLARATGDGARIDAIGARLNELDEKYGGNIDRPHPRTLPRHVLAGDDLTIGGEGMRVAYDQRIPSIFQKLVKKHGGKVDKDRLGTAGGAEVWTVSLPTALREAVLREGLPLFQGEEDAPGGTTPRGFMERSGQAFRVVVNPTADLSTFLHESGHIFLEMFADLAARADAPASVKADFAATLAWLGADSREGITREHHEKWARGFEAYLLEGKAPSEALARPFERYRFWLVRIYRSALSLKVDLSPEIRGVFDRLLATDEEIALAHGRMGLSRPLTQAEMAASPEEYQAYLDAREKATSTAAKAANLRLMKERLREQDRAWKEEEAQAREEAALEFERLPARRAWMLLHGRMVLPDGTSIRLDGKTFLDREAVVAALGPEKARRFPTKKGGASPDALAEQLGFASGAELLKAADALPEPAAWAKARAAELMKERHPGLLEERSALRDLVEKGLHGDFTVDHLRAEIAALRKRTGGQPPRIEAMKRAAELIVERLRVGEIHPHVYQVAEKSNAEKKFRAAAAGNFEQAAAFAEKQTWNLLLWRAARELKGELEAAEEALGKRTSDSYRAGLGKASPDYLALHDAILGAVGLGPVTSEPVDQLAALDAAKAKAEETDGGFAFDLDAIRALLVRPKGWRELSVGEARNVRDAVKNIRTIANAANEITLAGEQARIEDLVLKIEEEAAALPDLGKAPPASEQVPVGRRLFNRALGLHGDLIDPEVMFRSLGPTMQAIFERYKDCKTAKYQLARDFLDPFVEKMKKLPRDFEERRFDVLPDIDKDLPIPEDVNLDGPRDLMWLFMVLMNMGNESNKERLLGGFGWSEAQVIAALNKHMPKSGFDLAQEIWTLNDKELWPKIAEKEQRKTGLPPGKIAATPLVTKYGTYAGGYHPAKYDKRAAAGDIGQRQDEAATNNLYGPGYVRASTLKSHTKKRAAHYENIVDLRWSVFPSHLGQVIHDLAFDEYVRDTARIIFHPKVHEILYRRLGANRQHQPREWLKFTANAQAVTGATKTSEWASLFDFFKSRMVVGSLGWSLTTAAGDFSNALVAMAIGRENGGTSVKYGVPAYLAALPVPGVYGRFRSMALSKSPELRNRVEAKRDDLRRQFLGNFGKKRGKLSKAREMVGNTVWFFLDQTDKMASTQIWLARYWQEKADGVSEADAIRLADQAVTGALVSPERAELPALIRNPGSLGGLLVFAGYFTKLHSITAGRLGGRAVRAVTEAMRDGSREAYGRAGLKVAEVAGRVMAVYFFANVVGELLAGRGREEDEEWEDYILRQMATAPLNQGPIVGPLLASAVSSAAFDTKYRVSARAAPAPAFVEQIIRGVGKVAADDTEPDDRVWAAVEAALFGLKFGVSQPRRTVRFLEDWIQGEAEPRDAFDATSGVLYGERDRQPANAITEIGAAVRGQP